MSWRKLQKSRFKPRWMPLHKRYYRTRPATPEFKPWLSSTHYWLNRFAAGYRTAPITLAVDTGRWFQRGPEQLNLSLKTLQGTCQLELAHSLRLPPNWKPFRKNSVTGRWVRIPDKYYQHTKSWRYCLDNPSHARAFQQLLRHTMAYCSGHDAGARHQGAFRDLYWREIGSRKELARWPIKGLCQETPGGIETGLEGHEVLEVVCLPGERPRRPKTLCGPRPREEDTAAYYDDVQEHWHRQLRVCTSRRLELRVRRICGADGEPAFYLNPVHEFDLPLDALRGLQRNLPSFWRRAHRHYQHEGNRGWPRTDGYEEDVPTRVYEVYPAAWMSKKDHDEYFYEVERDQHGRVTGKHRREREKLQGALHEHRQFRWAPSVMNRYLSPPDIDSLCRGGPQDGLWDRQWSDEVDRASEDYLARLALWQAGLLYWDAEWSVSAEQALEDLQRIQQQQHNDLTVVLQTLLLSCCLRFYSRPSTRVPLQEPLKLTPYRRPNLNTARGPPG